MLNLLSFFFIYYNRLLDFGCICFILHAYVWSEYFNLSHIGRRFSSLSYNICETSDNMTFQVIRPSFAKFVSKTRYILRGNKTKPCAEKSNIRHAKRMRISNSDINTSVCMVQEMVDAGSKAVECDTSIPDPKLDPLWVFMSQRHELDYRYRKSPNVDVLVACKVAFSKGTREEVENATQTICDIIKLKSDDGKKSMKKMRPSFIIAITRRMSTTSDASIIDSCCRCLYAFVNLNLRVQSSLIQFGVVSHLMRCVLKLNRDEDVRLDICNIEGPVYYADFITAASNALLCLCMLCIHHDSVRNNCVYASGILETLTMMMKSRHEKAQHAAVRFITNTSYQCDSIKQYFAENEIPSALIYIMEHGEPSLHEVACAAFITICKGVHSVEGIFSMLVSMLLSWDSPHTIVCAAQTIRCIISANNYVQDIVLKCGVIEKLVKALGHSNKLVQKYAMKCLDSIAYRNYLIKNAIVAMGAVPLLASLLFSNSMQLVKNSLKCLLRLCVNQPENHSIVACAVPIVAIPNTEKISVLSITDESTSLNRHKYTHITQRLVGLLYCVNTDVQLRSIKLMLTLTVSTDNTELKNRLIVNGALTRLIALLYSSNIFVSEQAAKCCFHFIKDNPEFTYLFHMDDGSRVMSDVFVRCCSTDVFKKYVCATLLVTSNKIKTIRDNLTRNAEFMYVIASKLRKEYEGQDKEYAMKLFKLLYNDGKDNECVFENDVSVVTHNEF